MSPVILQYSHGRTYEHVRVDSWSRFETNPRCGLGASRHGVEGGRKLVREGVLMADGLQRLAVVRLPGTDGGR